MDSLAGHQQYPVSGFEYPIQYPHQHHYANIVIKPGINDQGLQRRSRIASGWRDTCNNRFEDIQYALSGLGAAMQRILGVDADNILYFFNDARWFGCR